MRNATPMVTIVLCAAVFSGSFYYLCTAMPGFFHFHYRSTVQMLSELFVTFIESHWIATRLVLNCKFVFKEGERGRERKRKNLLQATMHAILF